MRSVRHIRTLVIGAALFIAGLAAGAALTGWASALTQVELRNGDTLASFLPDGVLSLTYATPGGIATIQRSVPGRAFQVLSTFADGRPAQRCTLSAALEGRLENLTTLTARRSISLHQRERDFPVQLGVLEVVDTVIGEPPGPMLVFINRDRTAIAVVVEGSAAEVTLKDEDLQWLKNACANALAPNHAVLRR